MTDAPSPSEDDDPFRPRPGHNKPPEPTAIERAAELIPVCDGWTTKGPLTNEDDARLLSEFLVQVRKARDALRAGADRQPHLDALAAIRATVAHLMEPHEKALEEIGARSVTLLAKLDIAIERIAGSKKVTGLLAAWIARKQEQLLAAAEAKRKEAEDAQRAAQRAVDRAALAPTIDHELAAQQAVEDADAARTSARRAPKRASVKGDLAPKVVSLHTYWSARIDDWYAAVQHYATAEHKAIRDAVQQVADADARRVKDTAPAPIPGVEYVKREQAQ